MDKVGKILKIKAIYTPTLLLITIKGHTLDVRPVRSVETTFLLEKRKILGYNFTTKEYPIKDNLPSFYLKVDINWENKCSRVSDISQTLHPYSQRTAIHPPVSKLPFTHTNKTSISHPKLDFLKSDSSPPH